jgi:uncharacterized protein (DUF2236 family)
MTRSAAPDFDLRDHLGGPFAMLASTANVIMQLSVPGVGYGVAESKVDRGNVLLHPWKRLRTTLTYLVVALFGTERDREVYREAVNRSHREVRSGPDSPVPYNAFDPDLQLWVAACLYQGFRDGRIAFLGPMTPETEDALYAACAPLATTLQVPPEAWPSDRAAFEEYWQEQLGRVRIDEPVRAHLMKVVDLAMVPRWMRIGNGRINRFFTIGFLHPEFREPMGFTWTARDQRRFDRWLRVMRGLTRLMPRWYRCLLVPLLLADLRLRVRRGWTIT